MRKVQILSFVIFTIVMLINKNLFSQEQRILLDEVYTDWDDISGVVDSA